MQKIYDLFDGDKENDTVDSTLYINNKNVLWSEDATSGEHAVDDVQQVLSDSTMTAYDREGSSEILGSY
jgi:hypothetical protein